MANIIDDMYAKENINDNTLDETGMEIKQFQDENGNPFYAKTHMDGIDGFEEYTEGLTQIAKILGDFIFDTGWRGYDYGSGNGVEANKLYASDGFECGIRELVLNQYGFGNKVQPRIKMIRVNLRNFTNGQQIAQLPIGFMSNTQTFYSRSGSGKQPIMIEIRKNGAVNVYIDKADQSGKPNSNWIYAQFTWVE